MTESTERQGGLRTIGEALPVLEAPSETGTRHGETGSERLPSSPTPNALKPTSQPPALPLSVELFLKTTNYRQTLPSRIEPEIGENLDAWIAERETVLKPGDIGALQVMVGQLWVALPKGDRGIGTEDHVLPLYVQHLTEYPLPVLKQACDHCLKTEKWFPPIATIREAADKALGERRGRLWKLKILRAIRDNPCPDEGGQSDAWVSELRRMAADTKTQRPQLAAPTAAPMVTERIASKPMAAARRAVSMKQIQDSVPQAIKDLAAQRRAES